MMDQANIPLDVLPRKVMDDKFLCQKCGLVGYPSTEKRPRLVLQRLWILCQAKIVTYFRQNEKPFKGYVCPRCWAPFMVPLHFHRDPRAKSLFIHS